MAEELKELLEKIQREGIDAAAERGRAIEAEARGRADEIIRLAEQSAARVMAEARSSIATAEESGRRSLEQASRDTIISLHQEIAATLGRTVSTHVHKELGTGELTKMIIALVKDADCAGKEKTIISLRKEDLEKIEKGLIGELGPEVRKGIVLRHSADIKGGFTISYDSGKSHYDFTEGSLADYISAYLKPELARILKKTALA